MTDLERIKELELSEEVAWDLIANAYGGNWDLAPIKWRIAAKRWRDTYHVSILVHSIGNKKSKVDEYKCKYLCTCDQHQYRKKPVIIEAYQMTPVRLWQYLDWPDWLIAAWNREPGKGSIWAETPHNFAARLVIGTLEGDHIVQWNDWIIRGVQGELYPCKPEIFEQTYEKVI